MRRAWLLVLALGCDAGDSRPAPRPEKPRELDPVVERLPPVRIAPTLDGAQWKLSHHFLGATDDLLFMYDRASHELVTFELATGRSYARRIQHAPAGAPTRLIATADSLVFDWDRTIVYVRRPLREESSRGALAVVWTGPAGLAPAAVIGDLVIGQSDDKLEALAVADGSLRWQRPSDRDARTAADATTLAVTREAGHLNTLVDYLDPRTGDVRSTVQVPNNGAMTFDFTPDGIAFIDYGGGGIVDNAGGLTWSVEGALSVPDAPFVVGPHAYYVAHRDNGTTIFAATLAGGTRTWTTTIAAGSDRGRSDVAESDALVFYATGSKVTALDRATGLPKWEHVFPIVPAGMLVSHDTLVIMTDDQIIGFPFASRAPTPSQRTGAGRPPRSG